jgi:plastocyanin
VIKRILVSILVVVLISAFLGPIPSSMLNPTNVYAASPQNYTVLVGAENASRGVDVMSFFPSVLHIHQGDMVTWKLNSNEIHTVTFLGGSVTALPDLLLPSPTELVVNPLAVEVTPASGSTYSAGEYVNSGILGPDPGQPTSYTLEFANQGTYIYYCIVHGTEMTGTIVVDPPDASLPSPSQVSLAAQQSVAQELAHGYALFSEAVRNEKKPVTHPDGTKTYYVQLGYKQGNINLMDFFPKKLVVKPGDTVVWELSSTNDAPHTVTFLNGSPEPPLIVPSGSDLVINPAVAASQQLGQPLTRSGIFSSGLLVPGTPATSYTLTIGNIQGSIPYLCLLHDASGMVGSLFIASPANK